jgi:hypothetical protein
MKIAIKCKGAGLLPVSDLVQFQGDLKILPNENYEKLKAEIIELGFSEPVSVWKDKKGKFNIINGHQRVKTVRRMVEEDGFQCKNLPVNYIEAESIKEARKKVLALTSQYGVMTEGGLFDYLTNGQLSVKDLTNFSFPEINLDDFTVKYFGEQTVSDPLGVNRESDGGVFDRSEQQYSDSAIKQIVLFFDRDRYEEVLNKLEMLREKWDAQDFSEVVGKLIDEASRNKK